MEQYAKANGFKSTIHFTDDGIIGARFNEDRPGFTKMIVEIASGNVAVYLCKDAYVKLRIIEYYTATDITKNSDMRSL